MSACGPSASLRQQGWPGGLRVDHVPLPQPAEGRSSPHSVAARASAVRRLWVLGIGPIINDCCVGCPCPGAGEASRTPCSPTWLCQAVAGEDRGSQLVPLAQETGARLSLARAGCSSSKKQ